MAGASARRSRTGALWLLVLLVVVAGVALSMLGAAEAAQRRRDLLDRLVVQRAEQTRVAVDGEMQRYRDLANAVAGHVAGLPELTRRGFQDYVTHLDLLSRYPGTSGIGFAVPVAQGQAEAARARLAEADPPVDLGVGDVPQPVELLVSAAHVPAGQPEVLGIDLALAPEPSVAMLAARDDGVAVLSPTYVLLRDRALPPEQRQRSFQLAVPVYRGPVPPTVAGRREALRGWVFVGFRGADFLADVLRVTGRDITVELIDGAADGVRSQLVTQVSDGVPVRGVVPDPEAPAVTQRVPVNDRSWSLRVTALPSFQEDDRRDAAAWTLGIGLTLTVLLAMVVGLLVTGQRRALRQVRRATRASEAAAADLVARQEFSDTLLETMDVAITTCDEHGRLAYFNRLAKQLHGMDADGALNPEDWNDHYAVYRPDGTTPLAPEEMPLLRALREGEVHGTELVVHPTGGPSHHLLVHARRIRGPDGRPMAVSAAHDITALREGEQALRRSEERFRSMFARGLVGMALTDERGRFVEVNPAFATLCGLTRGQLLGRPAADLFDPADAHARSEVARAMAAGEPIHQSEQLIGRADGHRLSTLLNLTPLLGPDGGRQYLWQLADITERGHADSGRYALLHDELTGLANATLLDERLQHALARHARRHHPVGVVLLDLDRLAEVNEAHGTEAGDTLLRRAAERLAEVVRTSDTVARLRDDQFVVVLEDLDSLEHDRVLQRLLDAAGSPVGWRGDLLRIHATAGLVFLGERHQTPADVLSDADGAMTRARALGHDRFVLRADGTPLTPETVT